MVIDSSAFTAVVLQELEEFKFLAKMRQAAGNKTSAVALMETSMVLLSRDGEARVAAFEALVVRLEIEIMPVDAALARIALKAFARYGGGRHKAGLNFGDCFSYALARESGESLLFKGKDFGLTDIVIA